MRISLYARLIHTRGTIYVYIQTQLPILPRDEASYAYLVRGSDAQAGLVSILFRQVCAVMLHSRLNKAVPGQSLDLILVPRRLHALHEGRRHMNSGTKGRMCNLLRARMASLPMAYSAEGSFLADYRGNLFIRQLRTHATQLLSRVPRSTMSTLIINMQENLTACYQITARRPRNGGNDR